jgi:uncharacterized membrane protein (DUF106 family)
MTGVLLSLLVTFISAFFYQKKKTDNVKEQLNNATYDKSASITEVKIEQLKKEQQELVASKEAELNRKLTKEELADVLKKI